MTGSRPLGGLLLAAFLLLLVLPVGAQEPARAGLVVQFDEGRIETRCLDVPGEGLKGFDLLQASGLEIVADVSGGMGVSICRIEGQGCAFPAQHCFCQCMGGAGCAYWNYFYREPGSETWTYSPLGAVLRTVRPGAVEAWVWGDGTTPPAAGLTFEAVCQPPAPTAAAATGTATARPAAVASPSPPVAATRASPGLTPEPAPSSTPGITAEATAETEAGGTPATTAAEAPAIAVEAEATASPSPPSAESAPSASAGGAGGYLAFAGMLLLLAAVGAVTWLRRR
jgi:hypothetical protein